MMIIFNDDKALYWQTNSAWYCAMKQVFSTPGFEDSYIVDYELTDEAPEEARKSFYQQKG